MPTHTDKIHQNKNQSVRNDTSQQRYPTHLTFQFVDNRPETIVQRKLQEGMKNSLQAKEQRLIQKMADNHIKSTFQFVDNRPKTIIQRRLQKGIKDNHQTKETIQRLKNLGGKVSTETEQYYAAKTGSEELLSNENAESPEPVPLYKHSREIDEEGNSIKVWTPRSRFVNKESMIEKAGTKDSQKSMIKGSGTEDQRQVDEGEWRAAQKLLAQIQTALKTEEEEEQQKQESVENRLYTAGINDCLNYATALQNLIFSYRQQAQGNGEQLVGRKWIHHVNQEANVAWDFHAATVVAEDGKDAVTLEGHSGKHELDAPQFHIRKGGKAGFETDNQEASEHKQVYQEHAEVVKQPDNLNDLEIIINNLLSNWKEKEPNGTGIFKSEDLPVPELVIDDIQEVKLSQMERMRNGLSYATNWLYNMIP